MNKKRLWAYIPIGNRSISMCLLSLVWLVALPAGALEEKEVSKEIKYTLWRTMHPGMFGAEISSPVARCNQSVGYRRGLLYSHCNDLQRELENLENLKPSQCKKTDVKDGTRYDSVWGRINGDPNGKAKPTENLEKHTGRVDKAIRCDLGDSIIVDWFTGDKGISCNNLGFLAIPPPPQVSTVEVVYFYNGDTRVFFSDSTKIGTAQSLDSFLIESCPDLNINNNFDIQINNLPFEMGTEIQSSGYYNQ